MASLKRRWTCDSSSTWEQGPRPKRTVVSPSSRVTTIARNSDVRMDMTEEGTARHGKVEIDQRCIHKRSTICSLSRWECCACIDLRPTASYYPVYADGTGESLSARRWRNYCPGCKGFWQRAHDDGITLETSLRVPTAKDIEIDATIGGTRHRIFYTISADMTVSLLKNDLAAIFGVHPAGISLKDNNNTTLELGELKFGEGLFGASLRKIICNPVMSSGQSSDDNENDYDDDEEMEDV